MFAILGSGFGLYGYLPALVGRCKQSVVLPERYRTRFGERSELADFAINVYWEEDEFATLKRANGVVLALRPIDQRVWISRSLLHSNIKYLLLEKPLAHSPEVASEVLDDLVRSCTVFRIGYTFRYTAWGKKLSSTLNLRRGSGLVSFHWSFLAHHYRHDLHNWKRFHSSGGGAIRFYGIHIIALLAEIGYRNVILSRALVSFPDEVEMWYATFAGPGLPECEVVVDTRSTVREFRVEQVSNSRAAFNTVFANLSDPFDSGDETCRLGQIDQRVSGLTQLCHSLWEEGSSEYEWYAETVRLWASAEATCLTCPIQSAPVIGF
jgi:predicted dehydrogenase